MIILSAVGIIFSIASLERILVLLGEIPAFISVLAITRIFMREAVEVKGSHRGTKFDERTYHSLRYEYRVTRVTSLWSTFYYLVGQYNRFFGNRLVIVPRIIIAVL
jgi:hypothetical protein